THAPTRATRATRATWAVPVILGVAEEPVQSGLAPGKGPWHAGCSWARRRGGPRRETILTEQGRLMKHSRTQGLASITGLTLVLGACSGDGYENEDNGAPLLDSHKQEILNGQTSNLDNVVKVYRRKASGSGLCTGTLLRNDIVLTAAHCVGTAD